MVSNKQRGYNSSLRRSQSSMRSVSPSLLSTSSTDTQSRPVSPRLSSLASSGDLQSRPASPRIFLNPNDKSTVVIEVPYEFTQRRQSIVRQRSGLSIIVIFSWCITVCSWYFLWLPLRDGSVPKILSAIWSSLCSYTPKPMICFHVG